MGASENRHRGSKKNISRRQADAVVTILKYHRINQPIPDGWRAVTPVTMSHHSRYSILIEKWR